jgi:hypothetical protein
MREPRVVVICCTPCSRNRLEDSREQDVEICQKDGVIRSKTMLSAQDIMTTWRQIILQLTGLPYRYRIPDTAVCNSTDVDQHTR